MRILGQITTNSYSIIPICKLNHNTPFQ